MLYRKYGKRLLDVLLSTFALIILIPLFLVLSCIIFADDPGPVLFSQKRIGKKKNG